MDLYHRLFSDSLGNAIRLEKNYVLRRHFDQLLHTIGKSMQRPSLFYKSFLKHVSPHHYEVFVMAISLVLTNSIHIFENEIDHFHKKIN